MPSQSESLQAATDFPKIAVVLLNVGAPDAPATAATRRFLKQFLKDPRIADPSRWRRWRSLNIFSLWLRARRLAKQYAAIWTKDGAPLATHTAKQTKQLGRHLQTRRHDVKVVHAMRYGNPAVKAVLEGLREEGYERILFLPVYPQYCDATTGSAFDAVAAHYIGERNMPELRFVRDFHDHEGYIGALVEQVRLYWETHGRPDKLLMSFRGIRQEAEALGEAYVNRCRRTTALLAEGLGLTEDQYAVAFQSCPGGGEWIGPQTASVLEKLGKANLARVDVVFPGLVADCIDTLQETDIDNRQKFLSAGGRDLRMIPCLNESEQWMEALAEIAEQHLLGWPTMQKNTEVGQPSSSRRTIW